MFSWEVLRDLKLVAAWYRTDGWVRCVDVQDLGVLKGASDGGGYWDTTVPEQPWAHEYHPSHKGGPEGHTWACARVDWEKLIKAIAKAQRCHPTDILLAMEET